MTFVKSPNQVDSFWDSLAAAIRPASHDATDWIARGLLEGALSPWTTWTALCLLRSSPSEGIRLCSFLERLRLRQFQDPWERRLVELHPSIDPIALAFSELCQINMLTGPGSGGLYHVTKLTRTQRQLIGAFWQRWSHPNARPALAATIGDWLFWYYLGTWPDNFRLRSLIAQRAAALCSERAADLRTHLSCRTKGWRALQGLADLEVKDLPALLRRCLEGSPSGLTGTALEIVAKRWDAPSWCSRVFRLFERVAPGGAEPAARLYLLCVRVLLHHGFQTERVLSTFSESPVHFAAELALLTWEHAPAHAPAQFRRALGSASRDARIHAAAALALINEPWSHAELRGVLQTSSDVSGTLECRAALSEFEHLTARDTGSSWEARFAATTSSLIASGDRGTAMFSTRRWILEAMGQLQERIANVTANRRTASGEARDAS